jgi:MoxR-like ATPase
MIVGSTVFASHSKGAVLKPSTENSLPMLGQNLLRQVLEPMKRAFVGKDEIIDLMGICLVAGENLFILGPPGTAKSALVHELGRRLHGNTFEYLLTRFTEPNELFGPFDIRKLREGELLTNTEGMLPEASLVFLDELLNANSAILNSLLTVLNERVFRRGRETRALPTLIVVGASNRLPEDDALTALFDRFLVRVTSDNVAGDRLGEVLEAGWKLDLSQAEPPGGIDIEDVRKLHKLLPTIDLSDIRRPLAELVLRLRHAGIPISDRRAVKLQRLVAASGMLCGRSRCAISDLWIFRHIWNTLEQQEVIAAIVEEIIKKQPVVGDDHPRARLGGAPDPEGLARDLDEIRRKLDERGVSTADRAILRDRLGTLAGRAQWVADDEQRTFLTFRIDQLWKNFETQPV